MERETARDATAKGAEMMDDQNNFIENLRTAFGKSSTIRFDDIFSRTTTKETVQSLRNKTEDEQIQLVDTFQQNGKDLNLQTHVVASLEKAGSVVVELIRSKTPEFSHQKHVVCHDHPDIAGLELWKRFNRESVTVHTTFHPDSQAKEKTLASFIGITAPDIGIADSATIVQFTEQGRPRSTSLVPSIHIAILRRENLVLNLKECYALLQEKKNLDSFVFISGPSKTADIEAHLVHGAHGPCEVHVILISKPPFLPVDTIVEETTGISCAGTEQE